MNLNPVRWPEPGIAGPIFAMTTGFTGIAILAIAAFLVDLALFALAGATRRPVTV